MNPHLPTRRLYLMHARASSNDHQHCKRWLLRQLQAREGAQSLGSVAPLSEDVYRAIELREGTAQLSL